MPVARELSPGEPADGLTVRHLGGRLETLGRDLVYPRENQYRRKSDRHEYDNKSVRSSRHIQHVEDDVNWVEDQPADDEIEKGVLELI